MLKPLQIKHCLMWSLNLILFVNLRLTWQGSRCILKSNTEGPRSVMFILYPYQYFPASTSHPGGPKLSLQLTLSLKLCFNLYNVHKLHCKCLHPEPLQYALKHVTVFNVRLTAMLSVFVSTFFLFLLNSWTLISVTVQCLGEIKAFLGKNNHVVYCCGYWIC